MPELDDAALERRLRGVLKEHWERCRSTSPSTILIAAGRPRGLPERFGRGRGITLLAAAALLLVGGALAAGSGLLRLPTVVPPVPAPSVVAVATASPDATSPSPSELAAPSASPIPVAGPGGVWIATGTMGTPRYGTPRCGSSMAGCSWWVAAAHRVTTRPPPSCTTRPAGHGRPPGDMLKPHDGFPPTLLLDGRVLVGDVDDPAAESDRGAEVYDPASGTWTSTGKMVNEAWRRWRHGHVAARRQGPRGRLRTAPSCTTPTAGPGPRPGR